MSKVAFLCGLFATLLCATSVVAINVFDKTATYSYYPSYSIDTDANVTTVVLNIPFRDLCAYQCTLASNCFAATFLESGKCLLQQFCGHVVLTRNSTAFTYVKGILNLFPFFLTVCLTTWLLMKIVLVNFCDLQFNFSTKRWSYSLKSTIIHFLKKEQRRKSRLNRRK